MRKLSDNCPGCIAPAEGGDVERGGDAGRARPLGAPGIENTLVIRRQRRARHPRGDERGRVKNLATRMINRSTSPAEVSGRPVCRTFAEYLDACARVPLRGGAYGPFCFDGRAPLRWIVALTDKVLANCFGDEKTHRGDVESLGSVPLRASAVNSSVPPSALRLSPSSEPRTPKPEPLNSAAGVSVEIDGVRFKPGALKGATITVGGGAQWGKTVLVLNFLGYLTGVQFANFGYYTPDQELLAKIVDTKFRPDVIDQQPWMAAMIRLGVAENASGRTVNRKNSFQVCDGGRKAFGHFCGMQKPPTTISLDAAALDEVDDIPPRNIGYVDGRMTGSPLALKWEIGTQRIAGAGQNQRVEAGSFHCKMTPCPQCGALWNLEENFPRIVRVRKVGQASCLSTGSRKASANSASLCVTALKSAQAKGTHRKAGQASCLSRDKRKTSAAFAVNCSAPPSSDPSITPEMGHDRDAHYYCACLNCGAELDRDAGQYVARNPEQVRHARFSIRVSQLGISAISLQEIVGAWYSAMSDPGGEAMTAFYCDRIAIPHAGAAQPITAEVLERARGGVQRRDAKNAKNAETLRTSAPSASSAFSSVIAPYSMSLSSGEPPRFAGCDMGPRCWFWCDEVRSPVATALVWAEMIASGHMPSRIPLLMGLLGVECVFFDAGGEPDLTTRLCLALNGLESYEPPVLPRTELTRATFVNIGRGLTWDGARGVWSGLRAAAVLFTSGEAGGIVQTVGLTQAGRIYPLIKCNRAESIQAAVNDFLTPTEGVIESIAGMSETLNVQRSTLNVGSLKSVEKNPVIASSGRVLPELRHSSPETRNPKPEIRLHPRARLPETCIGAGAPQAVLDTHLLNLRRVRNLKTGSEDWADKVENHLGLAKVYARLCACVAGAPRPAPRGAFNPDLAATVGNSRWGLPTRRNW